MKFQITMKDPDGFYDSVMDAARESVKSTQGITNAERDSLVDSRAEDFKKVLKQWFEYCEYLTVEVDTDAKTISVVPCE